MIYFGSAARVPSWTGARETCSCCLASPVPTVRQAAVLAQSRLGVCAPVHARLCLSRLLQASLFRSAWEHSLVLSEELSEAGVRSQLPGVRNGMSWSQVVFHAACQKAKTQRLRSNQKTQASNFLWFNSCDLAVFFFFFLQQGSLGWWSYESWGNKGNRWIGSSEKCLFIRGTFLLATLLVSPPMGRAG